MRGHIIFYVEIYDLLFNGAVIAKLHEERPKPPFISITKDYDRGMGDVVYRYYFKGVYLGGDCQNITIGGLDDALAALRGRGVYQYLTPQEIVRKPLKKEDERIVKRLGLWAFEEYEMEGRSRRLKKMPFDKSFDGGFSLCHATGYEVFIGGQWWNEYIDAAGELQYGR